ncbi:MAG: phytanoyl-CoA dioxygenase family protein [Alphaproteobacteria bacterium]
MTATHAYLRKHGARLHHEFDLNGFVSLPDFFSGDELAELRANKDRLIRDVVPNMPNEEVYYENRDDPTTLKQLQQIWRHDDWFGGQMRDGTLRTLAEIVLDEPVRPVNMQYFNKPPGIGKPTPPHQDGFYFHLTPNHALTIWVALEDVEPEQGCVSYVQGSHKHGMRWHARTQTLGFSQGMVDFGTAHDRAYTVSFPCKAGHLIAHHSLTIHWADGNTTTDRSREAMGGIYYAASCGENERAKEAYQAQLTAQLAVEGKI